MTEQAYIIIVSSIPTLSRTWRQSPNAVAEAMNRNLLMAAVAWVQRYQREVQGREMDDFTEFTS